MTVKRSPGKSAIVIWILVELVLLIVIESIVNLDHARLLSDVQYAAIVCNTIMTYLFFRAYGTRPENAGEQLMACGLFATAAADFFMTFLSTGNTDPIYNTGVLLFCVVQFIYMQFIKPDKSDMTIGIRGALPLGTLHDDIALLVWLFYVPAQVCLTLSYIRSLEKSRPEAG